MLDMKPHTGSENTPTTDTTVAPDTPKRRQRRVSPKLTIQRTTPPHLSLTIPDEVDVFPNKGGHTPVTVMGDVASTLEVYPGHIDTPETQDCNAAIHAMLRSRTTNARTKDLAPARYIEVNVYRAENIIDQEEVLRQLVEDHSNTRLRWMPEMRPANDPTGQGYVAIVDPIGYQENADPESSCRATQKRVFGEKTDGTDDIAVSPEPNAVTDLIHIDQNDLVKKDSIELKAEFDRLHEQLERELATLPGEADIILKPNNEREDTEQYVARNQRLRIPIVRDL